MAWLRSLVLLGLVLLVSSSAWAERFIAQRTPAFPRGVGGPRSLGPAQPRAPERGQTVIYLVRHGKTKENSRFITQGQTRGTLSRRGEQQADQLGRRLSHQRFAVIYSSDSERTRQTLARILRFQPATRVRYTQVLRERSKGIFEGKFRLFVELYERAKGLFVGLDKVRAPGGESREELDQRSRRFFDALVAQARGQQVLVVTHGGVISSIEKQVLGLRHAAPSNASVTKLVIDRNGTVKASLLDSTWHLRPARELKLHFTRAKDLSSSKE